MNKASVIIDHNKAINKPGFHSEMDWKTVVKNPEEVTRNQRMTINRKNRSLGVEESGEEIMKNVIPPKINRSFK